MRRNKETSNKQTALYPMRRNKETSHKQTTLSPVGRAGEGLQKAAFSPY